MRSTFGLVLAMPGMSSAFVPGPRAQMPTMARRMADDGEKKWTVEDATKTSDTAPIGFEKFNIPNPLSELSDMFSNFDDVIDDFFNKRMGNGEIFYGKRKYKPSGQVESQYNGGGFSDYRKIEAAREFREERARLRQEATEKVAAEKRD